jgi:hypothetical protein
MMMNFWAALRIDPMNRAEFRPAGRVLGGVALLAALGACASGTDIRAVNAPGAYEPVAVVAAVEPEDGPQVNQWGGIVPEAKPVTPVDDGALGEIGARRLHAPFRLSGRTASL